MITNNIMLNDIPCRGKISGVYGRKVEMIQGILYNFLKTLARQPHAIIEIIDNDRVFNNNNDLRRTFQQKIEDEDCLDLAVITMRQGRLFLMDADSFTQLLAKENSKGDL